MPLPTTFAGDASRAEGQWYTSAPSLPPIGGPYWVKSFESNSPTSFPNDAVGGCYVDVNGNLYTLAQAYKSGSSQLVTMMTKHNSSGVIQWSIFLDPDNGTGISAYTNSCMAEDSSGNMYVLKARTIIYKISPSGTVLNTKYINDTDTIINAIAIDSSDNIYVGGGATRTSGGARYAFLQKMDSSFNTIWGYTFDRNNYQTDVLALLIDKNNNINVTGYSILGQFSSSGSINWVTCSPSNALGDSIYVALHGGCVDSNNNIYVTGGNVASVDGQVLTKLSSSGTPIWSVKLVSSGSSGYTLSQIMRSCFVDSSDNVYVFGSAADSSGNIRAVITKISSSGSLLYSASAENDYQLMSNQNPINIPSFYTGSIDRSGNVYLAGCTNTNAFDSGKITFYWQDGLIIKDTNDFANTHTGQYNIRGGNTEIRWTRTNAINSLSSFSSFLNCTTRPGYDTESSLTRTFTSYVTTTTSSTVNWWGQNI